MNMDQLQPSIFYSTQFTIESNVFPIEDLLGRLILHIREWLTQKQRKNDFSISTNDSDWEIFKYGGTIPGEGISIFSEYCHIDESFPATFWACRIIEKHKNKQGFKSRYWITEIGFIPVNTGKVNITCVVSYYDDPEDFGESDHKPGPNIPKIIKNLWEDRELICKVGIDEPSVNPIQIRPGEWNLFWNRVIDNNRSIPYIYISPLNTKEENNSTILIDPEELANAIYGNAKVYYALDNDVTNEMNTVCPSDFVCYNGGIRLYYPNVNVNDSDNAMKIHSVLGSQYIKKKGKQDIINLIRYNILQYAICHVERFSVEDCRAKRETLQQVKQSGKKDSPHLSTENNHRTRLRKLWAFITRK